MKQIVIGTAGHIDHGKTALIKALTDIDCDRLKEEKERGITIELGFAHYRFADDMLVGIVDVPGHERFVKHMVAGAWGIDMVLFVVAADESVMPQTREHLDICELLGIKRGIIAVTKKDLADDEMVDLVKEEVHELVKGRFLEDAPIIAVSSATGENINVLRDAIKEKADEIEEKSRKGIFRLPVDRVFTIRGFGTIVTGTCISGRVNVGDELEIYPVAKKARVRNIQAYHADAKEAGAGQRVALNLQGVEKQEIERGVIISSPETLLMTNRIDATLRYLKLPFKGIRDNAILRFHIATTQVEARLILLDRTTIEPGEEAFVQFVFAHPVVVLPGDRYILRGSYAIQTLGGGSILDIAPLKHKRNDAKLNDVRRLLEAGTAAARMEYHIQKGGYAHYTLAPLGADGREQRDRGVRAFRARDAGEGQDHRENGDPRRTVADLQEDAQGPAARVSRKEPAEGRHVPGGIEDPTAGCRSAGIPDSPGGTRPRTGSRDREGPCKAGRQRAQRQGGRQARRHREDTGGPGPHAAHNDRDDAAAQYHRREPERHAGKARLSGKNREGAGGHVFRQREHRAAQTDGQGPAHAEKGDASGRLQGGARPFPEVHDPPSRIS
jgi:translation elongation factor TU